MQKTKIEIMREELHALIKEREKIRKEKGEAAEHNKDLRENADYQYWEEKEHSITARILRLIKEIEKES